MSGSNIENDVRAIAERRTDLARAQRYGYVGPEVYARYARIERARLASLKQNPYAPR